MDKGRHKVKAHAKLDKLQQFGVFLVGLAILLLLTCGILAACSSITDKAGSGFAAAGFFIVMLGITFIYPDMLKGRSGATSAMRVCVFMIVSVFVVLVAKIGWATPDISKFTLDSTWAYVIGIALGAKTIQYFGEKAQPGNSTPVNNAGSLQTIIDPRKTAALGTTVLTTNSGTTNVPKTPPIHIQQALNELK